RRVGEGVVTELPARVFGIDAVLRCLPVDVGVGVEMLDHRLVAQAVQEGGVRLLLPRARFCRIGDGLHSHLPSGRRVVLLCRQQAWTVPAEWGGSRRDFPVSTAWCRQAPRAGRNPRTAAA